jgi:isopenicillin N synthase-like dioxygenase
MSDVGEIPVISIAALRSDDRAKRILCAKRIGQACREVGFFYAVDHGVDPSLVTQAFATAAAFFALPADVKMRVSRSKSRRHRGYFALRGEITNPSAGPDRKEGFRQPLPRFGPANRCVDRVNGRRLRLISGRY